MPRVRIVAPDAPFSHTLGAGHQWFDIDGKELRPGRIMSVRRSFDHLIAGVIASAGFRERLDRVAFVGLSQGAIVALDAVASGRWKVGALVSIAGLLPPIAVSQSPNFMQVLMLHGAADQTVPAAATRDAAKRLLAAGFEVETHILPGLGHTISSEELELARAFLIRALAI
jgi:phospholipase/carboxylesterase